MEPLWSPVVATGGNRRQIEESPKPQKQAKTFATGCHRLPETFHGKEGVCGSSPEEGSASPGQQGLSSSLFGDVRELRVAHVLAEKQDRLLRRVGSGAVPAAIHGRRNDGPSRAEAGRPRAREGIASCGGH